MTHARRPSTRCRRRSLRVSFQKLGWVALFFLVVCLSFPAGARAQPGAVEGRVTDQQNAALVGATVTAISPVLAVPDVAITDDTGAYRFSSLPPGTYSLTFAIPGFRVQQRDGITLRPGAVSVVSVQLALAPIAQRVDVVGVAPVLGSGVSRDRVPATVSVIEFGDLAERGTPSLADGLNERLGSITLEGTTSNQYQPTLRFRGFAASPLLGLPQGLAVYQNGVRINEPFGDTVQFDLIPQFAVDRLQLSAGAEPTYGLNALGGALALRLKNGFDHGGFRGEVSGGSFDRFEATAEHGASHGPWATYVGATRFDETGWRVASPSEVTQAVADVGYRREGRVDAGVSFTYADTTLNGNGPAPVELLEADREAVFTFPDTTDNRLAFGQGRFNVVVSPIWAVQMSGYYRDLDRRTLNGDEAEFTVCDDDVLPPGAPLGTLCAGAGDDDVDDKAADAGTAVVAGANGEGGSGAEEEPGVDADPLVDILTGRFITANDAEGDAAFNRTATRAKGYGAAFQTTANLTLDGRDNVLILGAAVDLADVAFTSNSEVGTLTPERTVDGSGLLVGVFGEAPDDQFNTVIDTRNQAYGLYFSDTFSLTDDAHLTVSGRYNEARIDIIDRLGTSLDGQHTFTRFNPGVGVVYEVTDVVSVFARYAESNRAPTAAELSCADPAEPCRVPNAFVADPPLEQAVAGSVEVGGRGRFSNPWDVVWSLATYRMRIRDDILFVASPALLGTGFFQNAGDTQRVGLDLELTGTAEALGWYLSYGLVHATFESPLVLPSNQAVNDAANQDGEVQVQPGDRLPGIPRHSLKAGARYDVTPAWEIALESIVSSSRIFVGDEGNDQEELDGYGVLNLRSSYHVRDDLELFVRVDNLLDQEYSTFGVLAEVELQLEEAPGADDPRFVSPSLPRSAFAGVRFRF